MLSRMTRIGVRFTLLYATIYLASSVMLLGLTFTLSTYSFTAPAPSFPSEQPVDPPYLSPDQERIKALEMELATIHLRQVRQLAVGSFVAMLAMVGVSLAIGKVMSQRVLRPLRELSRATRRISADNLDHRLAVRGPEDEVKHLADTIDSLLDRLETSFTAQRRFVANAAHELRTPLSTMRASLDVAVAKPGPHASTVALADRLRPQLDRVDALLDGFLLLARAQHGAPPDATEVDVGVLIGEALQARAPEIERKGLRLTVDVSERMTTRGSPALLARTVDNLVNNAVTHNSDGGWLGLLGRSGTDGLLLAVENGGPRLDQRKVDRLTEPFERLGPDRVGSSGLGLSIVAAVATAHGGRLTLLARPDGGLRATLKLPPMPTRTPAQADAHAFVHAPPPASPPPLPAPTAEHSVRDEVERHERSTPLDEAGPDGAEGPAGSVRPGGGGGPSAEDSAGDKAGTGKGTGLGGNAGPESGDGAGEGDRPDGGSERGARP
jgi:signal transduction histidine kinase